MTDEVFNRLEGNVRRCAVLLQQLRMWSEAEVQGIDSSQGGSFGLDEKLFTFTEKREFQRHRNRFVESGSGRVLLYNSFWYPDRRQVRLDPMLEAPPSE